MAPGVKSSRAAFTLVELLAVVAIIGLLAALVLPALRNALVQGRRAKSVVQLHQIGVAFCSYAADHDGLLASTTPARLNNNDYTFLLCPYLNYPAYTSIPTPSQAPIFYSPVYGSRKMPTPWAYIYNTRYTPINNTLAPVHISSPVVQYDLTWNLIPNTVVSTSRECSALYLLRDSFNDYNGSNPAAKVAPWPDRQWFYLFIDGHVIPHDNTDTSPAWTQFPR